MVIVPSSNKYNHQDMGARTRTKRSPVFFFVLTFLLSVPFYILNALAHMNIVFEPAMGALYISLLTLTPITSASILTFRRSGRDGVKGLLGRILDLKRITRSEWYVPILLLTPLIFLLSLGVMVLSGAPIPPALTPAVALPAVFLFFFILASGEEVGWMGYAFEPMQAQGGALRASLVLGIIWAVWHLPFFVFMMADPVIILTQILTLVGTRILAAWIFNNTGKSVFAVILFHAADNTALVTLPEVQAISPWGAVVTCGLVLAAAAVVTLLWGPKTLARFRSGN
jgi:membrane protease YdiL (CAAX protease family)